jgi:hypothetical protein
VPADAPTTRWLVVSRPDSKTRGAAADPPGDGPIDGVDFDIVLPSLGCHPTLDEGTGADVLARGPGHNTYRLGMGNLKTGDRVDIQARHGLYTFWAGAWATQRLILVASAAKQSTGAHAARRPVPDLMPVS